MALSQSCGIFQRVPDQLISTVRTLFFERGHPFRIYTYTRERNTKNTKIQGMRSRTEKRKELENGKKERKKGEEARLETLSLVGRARVRSTPRADLVECTHHFLNFGVDGFLVLPFSDGSFSIQKCFPRSQCFPRSENRGIPRSQTRFQVGQVHR